MRWFSRDILALDWDHHQLRAVSARVAKDRVMVLRMFRETVSAEAASEDPEAFGRWLARVLARHHCARMRTLVAIPRDQAVLKDLLLPAQTPDLELASLVQFQMQKELPFGLEEAVIDYTVAAEGDATGTPGPADEPAPGGGASPTGTNGQPGSTPEALVKKELLVAATRREVIEYYRKVGQAAGLTLVRIGLRSWCNLQTTRACAPTEANRRLLLVNVGAELTEIDIICGGGLLFSRSASVPLNGQDDAGEFLNGLTLEVVRSVQAARATVADLEVDAVVVAAPQWLAEAIAQRLGQRLDVRSWVLEPGRAITLPAKHREGAGEFSAALGLVLGETAEAASFNFLNPHRPVDLVARRKRQRRLIAMAVAGAAAVILAVNTAALSIKDMGTDQELERVKKLEAQATQVRKLSDAIARIRREERTTPVWLVELKKINELWMSGENKPNWHQNAYVHEFTGRMLDKGGWEVHLRGSARRPEVVIAITEKLRKVYPDEEVESKPPSVDQGQTFGYRFELRIRHTPPRQGRGRRKAKA